MWISDVTKYSHSSLHYNNIKRKSKSIRTSNCIEKDTLKNERGSVSFEHIWSFIFLENIFLSKRIILLSCWWIIRKAMPRDTKTTYGRDYKIYDIMTMQAFSSQDDNSLGNVFSIAKYDESFAVWSGYERCPLASSSSLLTISQSSINF